MTYKIFAFDGIELPDAMRDGDLQNMGTGEALSSYMQIPSGFFDHYGTLKSPSGIRPITLQGIIRDTTASALMDDLDALRQKKGERGILTIKMGDDSLRWQYARLRRVDVPREATTRGNWLPFTMEWETVDQAWRGVVVTPAEWTWGDLSWTFGDGTAEYGEQGTSTTLTSTASNEQAVTVTNDGNITVESVALTITPGTSTITLWQHENGTTDEIILMNQLIGVGEKLTINGGDRSVWLYGVAASISSIGGSGALLTVVTTAAHGLVDGDTVEIFGTTDYDGVYTDVDQQDATTFFVSSTKFAGTNGTGTTRKMTSIFDTFQGSTSAWPTLAAGDNSIAMKVITGNGTQDATVSWEYYAHYA